MGMTRRSLLQGSLGVGGIGMLPGSIRVSLAQTGAPKKAEILTSAGLLSVVLNILMKQEGFFQQMGVDADLQTVSDGNKINAALVGGSGDMCAGSGFSSLLPAIGKGAKMKVLAGAGVVPITCLFTKRPDIKSSADLVGKTVGTGAPGALLHELVVGLLIKKGIDYTKVNFVNVGSSTDVFKAVVAGAIDCGPAEVDVYEHQDKYGVHALTDGAFWDELPEYTNQAMYASDEAIAGKRDLLVRCMAAYAKAYRFIQRPDSFDAWRKAREAAIGKDEAEEAKVQWTFFNKPGRLAEKLVLSQAQIDYVQNLNVKLGVQPSVLPFAQVADMSLAQDALKLLS